jgi:hypothetical protein
MVSPMNSGGISWREGELAFILAFRSVKREVRGFLEVVRYLKNIQKHKLY